MAYLGKKYTVDANAAPVFELLPAGRYVVEITDSDIVNTKRGDGWYLMLNLKIIEGQHKGRTLIDRLNLENPNPKAVEIAERTFNQILTATRKSDANDSSELHGIPMIAVVRIEAAKGEYGESNKIGGYLPYEEPDLPLEVPTTPAKPAARTGAPWSRKKEAEPVKPEDDEIPY